MASGNDLKKKRYFWLKLQKNFFKNARIKKLRKIAGGDTYTIIYLKLMLLCIDNEGIIIYEGIEESLESELALKLDEDVDNIAVTLNYLRLNNLLVERSEGDVYLPEAFENTGSETHGNVQKRNLKLRANVEKVENFYPNSTQILPDIDIEKEIEEKENEDTLLHNISSKEKTKQTFKKPTIEEVFQYVYEQGYQMDSEAFYDFYESKNWMVGRNKMKDWKASVRNWARNEKGRTQPSRRPSVGGATGTVV